MAVILNQIADSRMAATLPGRGGRRASVVLPTACQSGQPRVFPVCPICNSRIAHRIRRRIRSRILPWARRRSGIFRTGRAGGPKTGRPSAIEWCRSLTWNWLPRRSPRLMPSRYLARHNGRSRQRLVAMQTAGDIRPRRQMARAAISLRERNRLERLQHICLPLFIDYLPDFFSPRRIGI